MKSFFEEFKAFAIRGNVVDLAVAVVIGGAFGKIVSSLVDDIVMPLAGVLIGGMDLSGLALVLRKGSGAVPDLVLHYGLFLNNVLSFLIIAFVIFVAIKQTNRFAKHKAEKLAEKEKLSKV